MRIRFKLDYVALTKIFLTGNPANAKAVIDARKAFKQLKKEYVPLRAENLAKTVVTTIPEMFQKSLIFAFYLKRRKNFSDLFITDKNLSFLPG
jgi:hypothetical protein